METPEEIDEIFSSYLKQSQSDFEKLTTKYDSEIAFTVIVSALAEVLQVYLNSIDPMLRQGALAIVATILNEENKEDLLYMKPMGRA